VDTGTLADSIGEGTASSRGCVASALLASDGSLRSLVPEGVAFPATVLTAVQRVTTADPEASFLALPVGNYRVEVLRLESGQYLVNLVLPPEPVSRVPVAPPARVEVQVEPVVTADWHEGALPAEEPEALAGAEEPEALPAEEPEALPAEEPEASPEPAEGLAVTEPPVPAEEAVAAPAEVVAEPEHPEDLAPPPAAEEPEVPLSSLMEASRAAAAEEPVAETVQALRSQLSSPAPRPEAVPRERAAAPPPPLRTTGLPPTRTLPHKGGGTYPSRGLLQAILITFIVIALAALWPLSPLPQLVAPGQATPVSSPSATASALPSPTGSPVVPSPSASPVASPLALTFTRALTQGVSGPDVAALQERLRQLGYFTYPQDTGYFGDATYGAVFTFQQVRLLPTTGVADSRTVEELNDCDQSCANPLSAR
jgi:hypothetical protein